MLIGLTDPAIYGITFAGTKTIEFGPLLGEALGQRRGRRGHLEHDRPADRGRRLQDPRGRQGPLPGAEHRPDPPSTAVLEAYGDQLAEDLDELSAIITTDDLRRLEHRDRHRQRESDQVATDWLESKGLI